MSQIADIAGRVRAKLGETWLLGFKHAVQRLAASTGRKRSGGVVFVAGAQRSGTNMVMDMLERSFETEVFHERDRRAFENYELRDETVLRSIVASSPAPTVVFKALCESQFVGTLLGDYVPSKAVWVYRHFEPVVRSHVRKWKGMPETMRQIAEDDCATHGWRGRGMSSETRALIRSCYHRELSNESACALFWYMRNVLFFEQGLDQNRDVFLIGYDHLVQNPDAGARRLFDFLDLEYRPSVSSFVSPEVSSSVPTGDLPIDEQVREACSELLARLEQSVERFA